MKTNIAVVNDQNSLCLYRLTQFYKTRLQTGRCTAPPLTSSRMHTTSRRRSQHRAGFCCKLNLAWAATERPSHPVLIQKQGKRCFAYMVTEATDVHKQCICIYKLYTSGVAQLTWRSTLIEISATVFLRNFKRLVKPPLQQHLRFELL